MSSDIQVLHPQGDVFLLVTRRDGENGLAKVKNSGPSEVGRSPSNHVVRMQVSSMNPTVSSPVFNAMLSEKFKEGGTLRVTGSIEIPLPDDDL
ncbi:hypothetical protein MMC14_004161 [Varicellaria rhodocarpa]|nr:hypothetical protein [Varicellaria rhodocarpa]